MTSGMSAPADRATTGPVVPCLNRTGSLVRAIMSAKTIAMNQGRAGLTGRRAIAIPVLGPGRITVC
jgi:hypothetical protein